MISWLIKFLATAGYVGYIPFASGTFATVIGWISYLFLKDNIFLLSSCIVTGFFVGVWVSTEAEALFQEKDSHKIVIDEVIGFWITMYLLPPTLGYALGGFFLFRLFDVIKPVGIRRTQALSGGWGVMIDDMLAGALANVILQLCRIVF